MSHLVHRGEDAAVGEDIATRWEQALRRHVTLVSGIVLLLAETYTVAFGTFQPFKQIAMLLLFLFPAAFMKRPLCRCASRPWASVVLCCDVALTLVSLAGMGYILINFDSLQNDIAYFSFTAADIAVGVTVLVLILEFTRRWIGWPLVVMSMVAIAYALVLPYLPGISGMHQYTAKNMIEDVSLSNNGIFGIALAVTSTEIYAFILFGAFLDALGAGALFIKVANAVTGRSYGGPAKASIVGSSMMATISGTAIGNIATIGTITIPTMKRAGFAPTIAAAIEACASSGGQLAPPVMGATAFVITAFAGVPYGKLVAAAAIPAFLFYLSLFTNVHLQARKDNIRLLEDPVRWLRQDYFHLAMLLLPVGVLVFLLAISFPTMSIGFWASAVLLCACLPSRQLRPTVAKLRAGVESLTNAMLIVAPACGAAGIIMAVALESGLGSQLSTLLIGTAHGSLFVLGLLAAVVCLILGTGLPTVVIYVLLATLVVPSFIKSGVNVYAANLFVFYYGIAALLIPPHGVAPYAAAAIADSNPIKTGLLSVWFAVAKYVVPFFFLFDPALVAQAPVGQVAFRTALATLAVICLSVGVVGYWKKHLRLWERGGWVAAGLLLGTTSGIANGIGAGLALGLTAVAIPRRRSEDGWRGASEAAPGDPPGRAQGAPPAVAVDPVGRRNRQ